MSVLERLHYNRAASLAFAPSKEVRARIQAKHDADPLPALPQKRERIRRPVDGKPVHRSEHQEQADVVSWWGMACAGYSLPRFALFAIPNGGARDMITGARLKAEGVRRGVFDLMLAVPRKGLHGLFLEMKVGSNKPSDEQAAFQNYLVSANYLAGVYWNCGDAIDAIKEYLTP